MTEFVGTSGNSIMAYEDWDNPERVVIFANSREGAGGWRTSEIVSLSKEDAAKFAAELLKPSTLGE